MENEAKNLGKCSNLKLPSETAARGISRGLRDEEWNCADENCPVRIIARRRIGMGSKSPIRYVNIQGCLASKVK